MIKIFLCRILEFSDALDLKYQVILVVKQARGEK